MSGVHFLPVTDEERDNMTLADYIEPIRNSIAHDESSFQRYPRRSVRESTSK